MHTTLIDAERAARKHPLTQYLKALIYQSERHQYYYVVHRSELRSGQDRLIKEIKP